MIGRRSTVQSGAMGKDGFDMPDRHIRGFDSYEVRLGDLMRGERATLNKSLRDVERDLKIKIEYIAAIENADPDAFPSPSFIPGFVRSYARYLGLDPDMAFQSFCADSGFSIAHGMSAQASSRPKAETARPAKHKRDGALLHNTPQFMSESEGFFSRIEAGAIGSILVLVALIGAIGYGGWTVWTEVQRVQFAPVENTPDVLSDLDPLQGASSGADAQDMAGMTQRREEQLDRLYRPEALDIPVLVARDAPISMLDPSRIGALGPEPGTPEEIGTVAAAKAPAPIPGPQVLDDGPPKVTVVAVRPAWIRVRAADDSVIYEGILNAGQTYEVPTTEQAPTIRVGDSGAVYFAVNGQHYGPVGARGSITSGLSLAATLVTEKYALAKPEEDQDLQRYEARLQAAEEPVPNTEQ